MKTIPSLTLLCLFGAACGDQLPPGAHRHADGTIHLPGQPEPGQPPAAKGDDHDHGTPHPLGELQFGAVKVQVTRLGDAVPGEEADFDVKFPAGAARPEVLRVWIGLETGVGSMKQRFANEGDDVMHGHVPVPKPVPDGSRIWFEFGTKDATQRASLAWQ